jgi:sulfite reductase (NADPH) hemoprotein beta-component
MILKKVDGLFGQDHAPIQEKTMAAPKHPQILFASDLVQGDVVFLGPAGWERDHRRARIAHDNAEAAALEALGKAEIAKNTVVDVYLADVEIGADGAPTPLHYREKMRVTGPSVRADLGKQAYLDKQTRLARAGNTR